MAVGGIIMAMRQDLPPSSMIAVIIPLMAVIIALMPQAGHAAVPGDAEQDRPREPSHARELSGIRVIRAFVRTEYEERRFDEANKDLTQTQLQVTRLFALMIPTLMGVFKLSSVAIIWFGAYLVDSGAMPIGNLTAFLAYIMQILMSVMMAVIMFVMIPRAAASATRIQEVLDVEPEIDDPENPVTECEGSGYLEFETVDFRYPGRRTPCSTA